MVPSTFASKHRDAPLGSIHILAIMVFKSSLSVLVLLACELNSIQYGGQARCIVPIAFCGHGLFVSLTSVGEKGMISSLPCVKLMKPNVC